MYGCIVSNIYIEIIILIYAETRERCTEMEAHGRVKIFKYDVKLGDAGSPLA